MVDRVEIRPTHPPHRHIRLNHEPPRGHGIHGASHLNLEIKGELPARLRKAPEFTLSCGQEAADGRSADAQAPGDLRFADTLARLPPRIRSHRGR